MGIHKYPSGRNADTVQKNAALIKREVSVMSEDITRLDERVARLQKHFRMADKDMTDIQISSRKISARAKKIGTVDFDKDEIETELPALKLVSKGDI